MQLLVNLHSPYKVDPTGLMNTDYHYIPSIAPALLSSKMNRWPSTELGHWILQPHTCRVGCIYTAEGSASPLFRVWLEHNCFEVCSTTTTLLTDPAIIPHQILHRPSNQSLTHKKNSALFKNFHIPRILYTIAPSYLLYQPQKQNKTENSLTVTLHAIKRQGTILPCFQNHPGIQSKFIKGMYRH